MIQDRLAPGWLNLPLATYLSNLDENPDFSMEEWHETEPKVLMELYQATSKLGGKISGEHGIGLKRRKYMEELTPTAELELMKKIKRTLDPNNIMNPGKIFDVN